MKKRLLSLCFSILLCFILPFQVLAEEEVNELQKDKKEAQAQVQELEGQLQAILNQMDELNLKLESKGNEIEKVSEELDMVSDQEETQYEDMKLRIRYMYEEGGSSFIGVLLTSSSFAELMNKAEYVQNVHEYDRNQLNKYIKTKKKASKIKKELEGEMEEIYSLENELNKQQIALEKIVSEKQEEVQKLDTQLVEAVEEAARKAEEERLAKEQKLKEEQEAQERAEKAQKEQEQREQEQREQEQREQAQKEQDKKDEKEEPQDKPETIIKIPSGDGVGFLDVVKAVSGQMLADGNWKYSNSNCKKNFEDARNASSRVTNCAHFVSLCMQEYGSLDKGMTFYGNSSGEIAAKSAVKNKLNQNCYIINMGKINATDAPLEPGDVCIWTGQHTNIYAGKDSKGTLCWYDAGGGMTSKGYFNRFYKTSNYSSRKLSYVIRMK